jgi:hypothetical protein
VRNHHSDVTLAERPWPAPVERRALAHARPGRPRIAAAQSTMLGRLTSPPLVRRALEVSDPKATAACGGHRFGRRRHDDNPAVEHGRDRGGLSDSQASLLSASALSAAASAWRALMRATILSARQRCSLDTSPATLPSRSRRAPPAARHSWYVKRSTYRLSAALTSRTLNTPRATKSSPMPTFNGRCACDGSAEKQPGTTRPALRCEHRISWSFSLPLLNLPFRPSHRRRVRSPSKYPSVRCQVLRVHVSPNLVNGLFVAISDFLFLPRAVGLGR